MLLKVLKGFLKVLDDILRSKVLVGLRYGLEPRRFKPKKVETTLKVVFNVLQLSTYF